MTIYEEIDSLIDNIKNDTNRTKLPDLLIKLMELSKLYGEAKREFVKQKMAYEREYVMLKEQNRQTLEKMADAEFTKELEENKKAKKNKVTNVDIESLTDLELLGLKDKQSEPAMTVAYLEPLIKSYYEIVNGRKFIDKTLVTAVPF